MQAAGIDRNTPDTQPGTAFWVRDAAGNPTGVALEGEWMAPYVAVGAWEPERMIRQSTLRQFAIAASHGTTTVQDPGLMTPNLMNCAGMKADFRIGLAVLSELDQRGELPLRAQVMPFFKAPDCDPAQVAEFAVAMKALHDSDTLRVRSIKIHPAANMESYGTPLIEPYADKPTHGHFGVAPETIAQVVLEANKRDIDIVMHAWGDAEVRAGIDAFEQAREAGLGKARNVLHHLGLVHPDDYPRLVRLKIPLNVTPVFSTDWTGQHLTYIRLLGEKRALAELAVYPDLVRAGLNLSISSDMPASGPAEAQAPLYNVEAAVTLRTPLDGEASRPFPPGRQGLSVAQALRAITIDAAWQLRMEDRIGSLETGKYADVVILEKNPFDVAPTQISEIKVLGTLKGGQFTHRTF
jgi:predicted amidohydrolase YtcJ